MLVICPVVFTCPPISEVDTTIRVRYAATEDAVPGRLRFSDVNSGALKSYGSFFGSKSLREFNFKSTVVVNGTRTAPTLGKGTMMIIAEPTTI
jgi:hypothetical protein